MNVLVSCFTPTAFRNMVFHKLQLLSSCTVRFTWLRVFEVDDIDCSGVFPRDAQGNDVRTDL